MLIDSIVLAPILAVSAWTWATSRTTALALEVPIALSFAAYSIFFTGRWGQTLGKMALKIRVVSLDGANAGFTRAFYRHAVDVGFAVLTSALTMYVLMSVTDVEYDALSFGQRLDLIENKAGAWVEILNWLSFAWIFSELIVLLLNEKRRALHDYIAGTVVIHIEGAPVAA